MFSELSRFGETMNFWQIAVRIILSVLISAFIGIEREKKNRPAGMRTHVLVCIGSTLISLLEQFAVANVVLLGNTQINVSMGRLTSAVVSGIGFLGAGTIIMSERKILGLTTAASLWCTACLGLMIGAGYIIVALFACAIILIVLRVMQRVIHVKIYKRLEVQFIHREETIPFLRQVFLEMHVTVLEQDFHAETLNEEMNLYTNVYTLTTSGKTNYQDIITRLSEYPNIRAVRTQNV